MIELSLLRVQPRYVCFMYWGGPQACELSVEYTIFGDDFECFCYEGYYGKLVYQQYIVQNGSVDMELKV